MDTAFFEVIEYYIAFFDSEGDYKIDNLFYCDSAMCAEFTRNKSFDEMNMCVDNTFKYCYEAE